MTPNRPYLIRALNEWILDNELTPHILVDADKDGVFVPEQFVEGGKIVLNISPIAVKSLQITNESITFSARFSGNSYNIFVPIYTILAIYSMDADDRRIIMVGRGNQSLQGFDAAMFITA